jgi:uncharacterized protein (TIGR02246 family)
MVRRFGIGVLFLFALPLFASPAVDAEVKARGEEFAAGWNRHDAKAMAALWAPDGDLINPFGRIAKNQADVEKMLAEEHAGFLKKTGFKIAAANVRALSADMALADWDVDISGASGPDGKALPADRTHISGLLKKANGKWWIVSLRAYDFSAMPTMAKK